MYSCAVGVNLALRTRRVSAMIPLHESTSCIRFFCGDVVGATGTRQQRQHIYACAPVASDLDWRRHHRNQPGQFMWQQADTTIYARYRV